MLKLGEMVKVENIENVAALWLVKDGRLIDRGIKECYTIMVLNKRNGKNTGQSNQAAQKLY